MNAFGVARPDAILKTLGISIGSIAMVQALTVVVALAIGGALRELIVQAMTGALW
jgi:hypothetical protein